MVADLTAASSAYAANMSRDGEAWQQTQIRLAWPADAANKQGRRSFAADADKGASTVGGKQLQLYHVVISQ